MIISFISNAHLITLVSYEAVPVLNNILNYLMRLIFDIFCCAKTSLDRAIKGSDCAAFVWLFISLRFSLMQTMCCLYANEVSNAAPRRWCVRQKEPSTCLWFPVRAWSHLSGLALAPRMKTVTSQTFLDKSVIFCDPSNPTPPLIHTPSAEVSWGGEQTPDFETQHLQAGLRPRLWWVSQHERGEMERFHFRSLRLIRMPHSGGYLRLMEIKGRKSLLYAPRRPPQTLSTLRGFAVLLRCPLLSAGPVPGSQDVVCFERRPNWHWLICLLHRAASRHGLKQQFKRSYWVWYQPTAHREAPNFQTLCNCISSPLPTDF